MQLKLRGKKGCFKDLEKDVILQNGLFEKSKSIIFYTTCVVGKIPQKVFL